MNWTYKHGLHMQELPDLINVMTELSIVENDLFSETLYWKWLQNKQMDTH